MNECGIRKIKEMYVTFHPKEHAEPMAKYMSILSVRVIVRCQDDEHDAEKAIEKARIAVDLASKNWVCHSAVEIE
jgi:hypothetical protein